MDVALYQINIIVLLLLLFDASHEKSYLVTPFPVDAPHDASAYFHYRGQCGASDWGLLWLLSGPGLLQHRMHRLDILHRHTARVRPWNRHCVCVVTSGANITYVYAITRGGTRNMHSVWTVLWSGHETCISLYLMTIAGF